VRFECLQEKRRASLSKGGFPRKEKIFRKKRGIGGQGRTGGKEQGAMFLKPADSFNYSGSKVDSQSPKTSWTGGKGEVGKRQKGERGWAKPSRAGGRSRFGGAENGKVNFERSSTE